MIKRLLCFLIGHDKRLDFQMIGMKFYWVWVCKRCGKKEKEEDV